MPNVRIQQRRVESPYSFPRIFRFFCTDAQPEQMHFPGKHFRDIRSQASNPHPLTPPRDEPCEKSGLKLTYHMGYAGYRLPSADTDINRSFRKFFRIQIESYNAAFARFQMDPPESAQVSYGCLESRAAAKVELDDFLPIPG